MQNIKVRHKNIPIFIPHLGCPNMCVFCNQRSISGVQKFEPEKVKSEIDAALETISPDKEVEIAYFGGSFTGIDSELMIYLLNLAESYIDNPVPGKARVTGIRMSTRPDYINEKIMEILSGYTVKTIELGLQSMDDEVLKLSKRGHTSKDAENACRAITRAGYSLVGQMMIGLPGSTPESELRTAEKIVSLGAQSARIYPTVVFYDTELASMTKRGEYTMLTLDESIERSKEVLKVFDKAGVDCIRIGLCASDNLGDPDKVMGGANHPSLGEFVRGEIYYEEMMTQLREVAVVALGKTAYYEVPFGCISKAIGQSGRNKQRLINMFGLRNIIIRESDTDRIILTEVK